MKGFVEYERKNILNFVRCKNMVHMKISIVVLSDNWTAEAFRAEITQKLQRIRHDLTIRRFCATVISATAHYWSFVKFGYLIKLFRWVPSKFRRALEASVSCFAVKRFPCDSSTITFIDSRLRVYVFFCVWFINARTNTRRFAWYFVSINVTCFRGSGFKNDRNGQSFRAPKKVKHWLRIS